MPSALPPSAAFFTARQPGHCVRLDGARSAEPPSSSGIAGATTLSSSCEALREAMHKQYARLNDFLQQHAPESVFLFEDFGWAEVVFTPFFMRFWFLDYYEDFDLPDDPPC